MKQTNSHIMSDDMALGFFDADGGILLCTENKENKSGKNSIVYKVVYFLGQSPSKADAVEKFAEKFNGSTLSKSTAVEFKVNQSSEVGKRVRNFLTQNKPKNPYRLRDFYISEQVIALLNKNNKSSIDQVTLANLVANKSRLKEQGGSAKTFADSCKYIGATAADIQQGSKIAESMLLGIQAKLEAHNESLATTKLSDDYALGAHFGDGSFYVGLSWKPSDTEESRLRCEPEWAISGDNEPYCQAFRYTFNGTTKSVDEKGQRKFVLSGVRKCASILPLFERATWMPSYKKEQFKRWRDSILLLEAQEHFSEEGIRKLLDLTYGLAEKGQRKFTKEQYLEWGLEWLNNPNRQKRKPRGEKPTEPNQ